MGGLVAHPAQPGAAFEVKLRKREIMSIKPVSTSPYADELDRLTKSALDALNRAIEIEMSCGRYSLRANIAWTRYRARLKVLGLAIQMGLDELWMSKPGKDCRKLRKAG